MSRKEMKAQAKRSLKKHYAIFVIACLISVFLGVESSNFINATSAYSPDRVISDAQVITTAPGVVDIGESSMISRQKEQEEHTDWKKQVFGRKRGVFARVVNSMVSGSLVMTLASGIGSVVGSENIGIMILIFLGMAFLSSFWFFVQNTYRVVATRIFLEGRTYEKVSIQRFLFLLRVRQWVHVSWVMFVMWLYEFLWTLTVVGGIIKHYSYYMVPYIMAENPTLSAKEAITLSREMMDGHKWQCFVFEASFVGWYILGFFTLGLSEVLFSIPYQTAAFTEYYVQMRSLAQNKRILNANRLNDRYLYEKADSETMELAYHDVITTMKRPAEELQLHGAVRFFADVFGILLKDHEKERAYEESQASQVRIRVLREAVEGRCYPARLFIIPEKDKRKKIETIHYMRHYTIGSLILLFFIFSFIGWVWEVSLHLIQDGAFVNRGVLHGPWLPIYGAGGVLILTVLNKFRCKPALEMALIVLLCGIVEYGTSYFLEVLHDGQKWWDYSGYFLNLNGRICAEGLLVFGLGGMAIVYVAAPLLDNLIRKIRGGILILLCVVLLGTYIGDSIYSSVNPNTGKGITDYKELAVSKILERDVV